MDNEHYLDNSATTRVLPEAAQKMLYIMQEEFGNPSSLHKRGYLAKKELEKARESVSGLLSCEAGEVYFTSGGTEANNMAIFGAARALKKRGNRIVTTAIEHDSVLNAMKELSAQGFEVVCIKPQPNGCVREEDITDAVNDKTILVSIMLVNNETGAVQPVSAAARAIKLKKAPALLHTDAVQAFGKLSFSAKKLGADLISVSSHKIHGPKGAGALYVRKGAHILPLMYGGGQEKALRSGTENMPGICGFGVAAGLVPKASEALPEVTALRDELVNGLKAIPGVKINSPENAMPYIVSFSTCGVKAETMLHFLSDRGIYVSSGSACGKAKPSHVLSAMGLSPEDISSSLRASFSRFSVKEDVIALLDGVKEGMEKLQKIR